MLPAPGGDVVRDGAGVLPTGRNIHALDPYRIPSAAAMVRGRTAATLILEAHRKKGMYTSHSFLCTISTFPTFFSISHLIILRFNRKPIFVKNISLRHWLIFIVMSESVKMA